MRLCMISLDAVSHTDADRLLRLPVLSALREKGVFCDQVRTVYPTITYPIHASLITGCYPESHGIGHNQPFQPDTPKALRKWYWEHGQIQKKTLHQAAREQGMSAASILWPVTGKSKYIQKNFPEVLPLPGESAVVKMLQYASPLWLLHMELLYGKQRKSIRQPDLDEYAALLSEKLYASRRPPDLFTLHLVDCDSMRHWHGVDSPEAQSAMERLDRHVGQVIRAIEKAGLINDTIICIVSDHGQKDAPCGVLLDTHLKAACGARAQTLGMGAYIFGDDLKKAEETLIAHQKEWKIARILKDQDLRALRAPRDVKLAVEAEDGCCFIDEAEETFGEHGFSLNEPQAKTLLWLCGPGVKKGVQLKGANLVDIAPTLAKLLGLSLPDAEGKVLTDALL
ncbi:MAG: alkaline phosphatase family protein [Clostridiales bacterium]|nr:alkaline phosphatase family protein [Clostridiales bacterium]